MKVVFYITNHGYGHASRNVPIIKELLSDNPAACIYVKSDKERCAFIKRNLQAYDSRIEYHSDCKDVGLVLKTGSMELDKTATQDAVTHDLNFWDEYTEREEVFLKEHKVDVVISDIIPWAITASKQCGIPCLLIGNFSWAQSYQSIGLNESLWKPYENCYKQTDKTLWYEIHDKGLEKYCTITKNISMVSREINKSEVDRIKSRHTNPIVFVSMGASADIKEPIDVSNLPFDVIYTRGIEFIGRNAYGLPKDMINTPDYICAASYVITKGGWSTVAEVMLQKKPAGLIFRDNLLEDDVTKRILTERGHCTQVKAEDLKDMSLIIDRIKSLNQSSYDIYKNDTTLICDEIRRMINND